HQAAEAGSSDRRRLHRPAAGPGRYPRARRQLAADRTATDTCRIAEAVAAPKRRGLTAQRRHLGQRREDQCTRHRGQIACTPATSCPSWSSVAASLLRANGIDNVSDLAGGYAAWEGANALACATAIPSTRWSAASNCFVARNPPNRRRFGGFFSHGW